MSVRLPIKQEGSHFRFVTELDSISYSFEFRWNGRDGAWIMTIGDGEGTPIVSGIKIVVNLPLTSQFRDDRLPPGFLIALDTAGQDEDAGYADLGRRVAIVYLSQSDLG